VAFSRGFHMRIASQIPLVLVASLLLIGCSDPYETKVPPEYFTNGEVQRIAKSLDPSDRELFVEWSQRVRTSQRYPGESTPPNVRAAILAQQSYELFDMERKRREEAQAAAVALRQQQEDARFELDQRRKAADHEISKFFVVKVTSYRREPIWAVNDRLIGYNWVFDLALKNNGDKQINAFKGSLQISDAFAKYEQHLSGQVTIAIPPRKTVSYSVTYPNNDDSALHNLMQRGQTINSRWTIDSVAFDDGTKFDYMSVKND
jgi:hypothetical protein